ncbi:MAG: amylo-alpha-1,6-glucosidase [Hyphomicrobiales bacterium]|nr:amylo-alpha-1,6-glucosidase [Hyphomicrobiales bacterium]
MLAETVPEVPFYIPATGPATRPRRTLKHDDCFVVLDSHGDIGATPGGPDGVYCCDTRYLGHLELTLNGMQLLLLGSNVRDDNSIMTADLTNPDLYFDQRWVLPKDTLHIVRTLFVWRATIYQRLRLENYGDHDLYGTLAISFASDFADLFEVRGLRRERRGSLITEVETDQRVNLVYTGLDGKVRRTLLAFAPRPEQLTTNSASYPLSLAPGECRWVYVTAVCCGDVTQAGPLMPFRKGLLAAFKEYRAANNGVATVSTSNDIFNEVLCRSRADLSMLVTKTAQGPYPYAGIPWYSTTFGRDGIVTAMEVLWFYPELACGVLRRLALRQAKTFDAGADAEPGKIVHELRSGEMAALGEIPFGSYYGTVDATPLFVLLAGLYVERTGDIKTLQELWPNIEAALAWIDGPGDRDGDGFVEYHRRNEFGLVNQGWKDSYDAVFHADGSLAVGPIALCEVQGYVYAAKRVAASSARHLHKHDRAEALDRQADALAARFDEAFWCDDIGTYALALDGEKRPCRVRTSNAGQVLMSGIAPRERAAAVARDLMRPTFFSGWGIRTVASEEQRYNPMSYHNGSVWPHDNALIAQGFAHYGQKAAVARVFQGLFEAASYMDLRRLPELYCGFPRGRGRGPTLYPVACSPQAWAAGAPFLLLQASLGLEFDLERNEILLRDPQLPAFLDYVTLRNLRLGAFSIDVEVRRAGPTVSLQVLRNAGMLRVAIVHS